MKKILLIGLASFLVATGLQANNIKRHPKFPNVLYNENVNIDARKEKCLFGWDLNSVVFTQNVLAHFPSMLWDAYKEKGIFYASWAVRQFFWLWREKKALKKAGKNKGFVWDAMFTDLERRGKTQKEKRKNKELARFLRQFSQQANTLEIFMADLLFDLNNAGHRNAVLSNMGQGLLDAQVEQIKIHGPHTPAISYVLDFLTDDEHKMIAAEANGWMHKPDSEMYQCFFAQNSDYNSNYANPTQESCSKDGADCRIFIDDKKSNCQAALRHGFDIAIVCRNQSQIRPMLKALGVVGL